MAPVLDVDGCNVVPAAQRGYYKCRTLDTTLVQRFVRLYGGSPRTPEPPGVSDPLRSFPDGVSLSGGGSVDEPVAIHWTPPVSPPSGSRVVVKRWGAASCGTAPSGVDTFYCALSPGTWQDSSSAEPEDACFQVQLVNRYGAGRAPASRLLRRWSAPPAAPEIGEVTWHPEGPRFHASASYPAGTDLVYDTARGPRDLPGHLHPWAGGQRVRQHPGDGVAEFLTLPSPTSASRSTRWTTRPGRPARPRTWSCTRPCRPKPWTLGNAPIRHRPAIPPGTRVVTGQGTVGNRVAGRMPRIPCPAEVPDPPFEGDMWSPTRPIRLPRSMTSSSSAVIASGCTAAFFTAMDVFGYALDKPGRHGRL